MDVGRGADSTHWWGRSRLHLGEKSMRIVSTGGAAVTHIVGKLGPTGGKLTDHGGNVQAETFWIGAVAFVLFAALSLVTLSYRNVANRHAHKADAYTRKNGTPTPEAHGH